MDTLLHICCAPCAIYPVEAMREEGHKVSGYFYNPNIHPYSEYLKRKSAVESFAGKTGLGVAYGDYDVESYLQNIVYGEEAGSTARAKEVRCPACWWMRLVKAAAYAGENGFEAFTTTLLGSPYQDTAAIQSIGHEVAKNAGLKFIAADFAKGFNEAHDRAKAEGIYCQNYCGCLFSEIERLDAKSRRAAGAAPEITVSVKGGGKKIRCSI
jgi:predicted adenine nucleotide alpha hydrolase (AANH) superfamily ATPase